MANVELMPNIITDILGTTPKSEGKVLPRDHKAVRLYMRTVFRPACELLTRGWGVIQLLATCSIRSAASPSETATRSAHSGAAEGRRFEPREFGFEFARGRVRSPPTDSSRRADRGHDDQRCVPPISPKRCRSPEILASTSCARSPSRASSPSSQDTR